MQKISIPSAGRVAYGIALIIFGMLHFTGADSLLQLVPDFMPFGHWFWVYFAGTMLCLAGSAIILRKFERPACILLATMFVLFILVVRVPMLNKLDKERKESFLVERAKETALAGSALVIAGRKKKTGMDS